MKKRLLTTIIVVLSIAGYSQNLTFKVGQVDKTKKGNTEHKLVGSMGNQLYFHRIVSDGTYGPKSNYLIKVNTETKRSEIKLIEISDEFTDATVNEIRQMESGLLLFFAFSDKQRNREQLYYQKIDENKLTLTGKPVMMIDLDCKGFSEFRRADFFTEISPDSTLFLVYHFLGDSKGSRVGFSVYDFEFNYIWGEPNITVEEKVFLSVERMRINNNGVVYIDCKELRYRSALSTKQFLLYRYSKRGGTVAFVVAMANSTTPDFETRIIRMAEGREPKSIKLNIPKCHIRNYEYVFTPEDELLMFGVYTKEKKHAAEGCFTLIIGPKDTDVDGNFNLFPFANDFLQKGMSDFEKRKYSKNKRKDRETSLYDYSINLHKVKQGYLVLAEQRITIWKNSTIVGYNGEFRDDILVASVSEKGRVTDVGKIVKRQKIKDTGPRTESYFSVDKDDQVYVIYHPGDVDRKYIKDYQNVCIAKVSFGGEISTSSVKSWEKISDNIIFKEACVAGDDMIMSFTTHKRNPVFVTIK